MRSATRRHATTSTNSLSRLRRTILIFLLVPQPGGPQCFDTSPLLDSRLPPVTRDRLSTLSLTIWEPATSKAYASMLSKWLFFCKKFERSSATPRQADINAYICWLGTVGSWAQDRPDGIGVPMAYQSIKDYVDFVGRALRATQPGPGLQPVVTESLQTHWALLSTKRLLGDSKQRARPITMDEILTACRNVRGSESFVLAFRVIVLTGWFGAFRLGQLLPHNNNKALPTTALSDLVLGADKAVFVTSRRSKTNVFNARMRTIRIGGSSVPLLCLGTAPGELLAFRRRRNLSPNVRLCDLDVGLATFEKLVKVMQMLIKPKEDTALEKGRITGHSFRRGFTKAALLAGYSLQAIMVHGDWNHEESVLNFYAVGAVLPSISLAPGNGLPRTAAGAELMPSTAATSVAAPRRDPPAVANAAPAVAHAASIGVCEMPKFSVNNPYTPDFAQPGSVEHAHLLLRARRWEIQLGPLSHNNPWSPVGNMDAVMEARRELLAREWEAKHSAFL
jgi:hypothetical protein